MLDLVNKITSRFIIFLISRKCPNCGVRKLIGKPNGKLEDGKLVFELGCFNCFAVFKSVGKKMTFVKFLDEANKES